MIALPSIAFGGFSGSAKGVTARQVGGRSILSVKCWPTGAATGAQLIRRASLKKISKSWKELTSDQMRDWNKLALSQEARSVLGTKGKISGANLFTRLNYWIVACGGTPETNPPTLVGVENPSSATIVCQGDTFTFKLDQALADNGGIFLVIEASEGQSNGVSRAHSKAAQIKMVEEPTATAIDIRADYVVKNGAPSAAAPKIFFRYYYVNSSTGEKSGVMLADVTWTAGE